MYREVAFLLLLIGVTYGLSTCDYNGVVYQSGQSFNSSDNCNRCFCSNGAVACTLKACLPSLPKVTCNYGNKIYHDGDHFDALDGCNSCGCQNGMVMCTEMFCLTGAPPP